MRLVVFVISSINIILSAYRGGATRVKKAKWCQRCIWPILCQRSLLRQFPLLSN